MNSNHLNIEFQPLFHFHPNRKKTIPMDLQKLRFEKIILKKNFNNPSTKIVISEYPSYLQSSIFNSTCFFNNRFPAKKFMLEVIEKFDITNSTDSTIESLQQLKDILMVLKHYTIALKYSSSEEIMSNVLNTCHALIALNSNKTVVERKLKSKIREILVAVSQVIKTPANANIGVVVDRIDAFLPLTQETFQKTLIQEWIDLLEDALEEFNLSSDLKRVSKLIKLAILLSKKSQLYILEVDFDSLYSTLDQLSCDVDDLVFGIENTSYENEFNQLLSTCLALFDIIKRDEQWFTLCRSRLEQLSLGIDLDLKIDALKI